MNSTLKIPRPVLFARVMTLDAVVTGLTAVAMALGAGVLASLTALPVELLRLVGLALLPFVAFVGWLSRHPSAKAGWVVAIINALYSAGCVALVVGGWVAPNAWGVAFVLVQAVAVLAFALAGAFALHNAPGQTRRANAL